MSMREEVMKLVKDAGGAQLDGLPSNWDAGDFVFSPKELGYFYQAAYLAGAKAMQEEAIKKCDSEKLRHLKSAAANNGRESDFAFGRVESSENIEQAIQAINPENLK